MQGHLGILRRSNGTLQVTLRGLPLYRYSKDHAKGDANGEGIESFGGTWHADDGSGEHPTNRHDDAPPAADDDAELSADTDAQPPRPALPRHDHPTAAPPPTPTRPTEGRRPRSLRSRPLRPRASESAADGHAKKPQTRKPSRATTPIACAQPASATVSKPKPASRQAPATRASRPGRETASS